MKKLWLGILATLLVVVFVAPSFAWEFSMTGEFEFRLRYFSRTGDNDLFGNAKLQNGLANNSWSAEAGLIDPTNGLPPAPATTSWLNAGYMPEAANGNFIGFAGPNIYRTGFSPGAGAAAPVVQDAAGGARVAIVRGGFSRWGCDALYNDWRTTFVPSIRVNNAIRVHGVYTIGGQRHKYAQRAFDANGAVSPGVPPFERYYMSQTSEAAYNTAAIGSWEQIRATIQLPIGIISIGSKDFPFGTGANFANNTRAEGFLWVLPYGPFRFLPNIWLARDTVGQTSWDTVPDKNWKTARLFWGFLMTYENGPLYLGAGYLTDQRHSDLRTLGFGADAYFGQWAALMKYNNGRFFANAEYSWINIDTTRLRARPIYAEGYNAFAEAGVMAGPGKLTLMWAQSSGPVLNHDNPTKSYTAHQVNYQVLEPYSYLIFPTYAGGNDAFNNDGTGQMADALALAARLDYSVAANLNLFGSFLYARRLEAAGYRAGGKVTAVNDRVNGLAVPASATAALAQAWKNQALGGGFDQNNLNPYPDDNFLGWEAMAGFDWKLLEGLSMNAKYSYWQVGPWFDTAYRAFSGRNANGLQGQGAIQGRDGIHAMHGAFVINF